MIFGNNPPLDYFNKMICYYYLRCRDVGSNKCLKCKNFHPLKEKEHRNSYYEEIT